MNKNELAELARKSGFEVSEITGSIRSSSPLCGTELKRFAKLVVAAERNKLAAWMIQFGFATGHGDTMDDLVDALGSEVVDRIKFEISREREACAKVCDFAINSPYVSQIAAAIRSRSKA